MTKRKVKLEKIQQKTIESLIETEKAYRRHKAFAKAHGNQPLTKEVFIADYLKHQEPRIQAIRNQIAKFNDKKAPIMNKECLEFRRLFSLRQGYIGIQKFSSEMTAQEWQIFYNHSNRCDSCTFYAMLHKDDFPISTSEFRECSQSEFERGLDEFYDTIKCQSDPLEEYETKQGFKPIPIDLQKHLSSEYAKQQETTQPENPYLEKINREFQEGQKEVDRINSLTQNKTNQWLNQKEEE